MPSKLHVKRNDEVVVITGKDKGKRGKVISVITKKTVIFVEGVNIQTKHVSKNQQNPNGTIIKKEGPIHASNVMLSTKFDARNAKRGLTVESAKV